VKPRKWIIPLGVLCFLLGILSYGGIRLLEKNRNIERILIANLSPRLGGAFDVERVRIRFLSVYLSNVRVSIPLRMLRIDVHDIKVGISLTKLVRTRGDLGRSISKIIFVEPHIEVSYREPESPASGGAAPPGASAPDSAPAPPAAAALPLDRLLIQRGTVNLSDRSGTHVLTASDLDGSVWTEGPRVHFELKGKVGAALKNLTLSGMIAPPGERHRISFRLRRARLRHDVPWRTLRISGGTLDGVGEFAFTDALSPASMESNGWVTLAGARTVVTTHGASVEDISLGIRFSDSRLDIDSLRCRCKGVACNASGVWDFARDGDCRLSARIDGIVLQELFDTLPPVVARNVLGQGWIEAGVSKDARSRQVVAAVNGGGVSLWGNAVTRLSGGLRADSSSIVVDSLVVEGSQFTVNGRGRVTIGASPPVYDASIRLRASASAFSPRAGGRIGCDASLGGLGPKIRLTCAVAVDSASVMGVALGNPRLTVKSCESGVVFESDARNREYFSLSGAVDSLDRPAPVMRAQLVIEEKMMRAALDRLPYGAGGVIESARIISTWSGPVNRLTVYGLCELGGRDIDGGVEFSGLLQDSTFEWRLSDARLRVSKKAFPLVAAGRFYGDSLTIDSLRMLHGAAGRGTLRFGKPGSIAVQISCAGVPFIDLDTWFLGSKDILRGGHLHADARVYGPLDAPQCRAHVHIRNGNILGVSPLQTDLILAASASSFTVLPFVIRQGKTIILMVDTVSHAGVLAVSGEFHDVNLGELLAGVLPEGHAVAGSISGRFASGDSGLPVVIHAVSPRVFIDQWRVDSVAAVIRADSDGIFIDTLLAADSSLTRATASGFVPWAVLAGEETDEDTIRAAAAVEGDLLATVARRFDSPIGGTGKGTIRAAFSAADGEWRFSHARIAIPNGVLTLKPFVLDDITPFALEMSIDGAGRLHTSISGKIRRRPITITSSHNVPPGYEPIMLGPINAGVLQVRTPKQGVALHLPGFQRVDDRVEVAFGPRPPFDAFTLAGPLDKLRICGTWTVAQSEFTFPFLETDEIPWEFDPSLYITWELDVRPGNRVVYFYDVGMRQRKFIRFCELTLDQGGEVRLRGRMIDNTFKIFGSLRSYRGTVYYGKTFDRNIDVGLDFTPQPLENAEGYDNMPVIWGSAEAFSDTSRFERIRLTLLTKDPNTGSLSQKGRFNEISFHLSSDFDELPGEAEQEFYRAAGLHIMSFKGAGGIVSDFGKQYIRRYFVQRFEKQLARRLGLDVVTFESSIAANYFYYLYSNRFHGLGSQWDYLALANVGITLGRYFLHDKLFLKWRSELIPVDTLLHPEHSIGLEYQPMRYLLLDVSYGIQYHEKAIAYNPKVYLQLRLPINKARSLLDF